MSRGFPPRVRRRVCAGPITCRRLRILVFSKNRWRRRTTLLLLRGVPIPSHALRPKKGGGGYEDSISHVKFGSETYSPPHVTNHPLCLRQTDRAKGCEDDGGNSLRRIVINTYTYASYTYNVLLVYASRSRPNQTLCITRADTSSPLKITV